MGLQNCSTIPNAPHASETTINCRVHVTRHNALAKSDHMMQCEADKSAGSVECSDQCASGTNAQPLWVVVLAIGHAGKPRPVKA